MLKKNSLLIAVLMVSVVFSGCLFAPAVLSKLVVSADADRVLQGNSISLSVVGLDKKNKEVEVTEVEWSLSDDSMGSLVEDGLEAVFTALETAEGNVTIVVKSGEITDSIEVEIVTASSGGLAIAIDAAKELKDSFAEGDDPGQVSAANHATFQAAIDAAEAVYDDENADPEDIVAAVGNLEAAIAAFEASMITGDLLFDRTDWTATGSNNGSHAWQVLDGDLDTNWHASNQEPGKYLEVDMKADQTFNLITLSNPGKGDDLPRGFEVYISADGESAEYGEPVYTGGFEIGESDGIEDLVFEELQTARWIKVLLTKANPEGVNKYFALAEFYVGTRY